MRVQYERTGGFAGMRVSANLDTASLPDAEARELEKLVADADFFNLPSRIASGGGADRFQYKVTVESDGKRHTVECGEANAPEKLKPLLSKLQALSRSSR